MLIYPAPEERPLGAAFAKTLILSKVKTWIGGSRRAPRSWSEPTNWYPAGVPSSTDNLVIGGYGRHSCRLEDDARPVMSVHVLPSATLCVASTGRLTVDGSLADPRGLISSSGLNNEGQVEIHGVLHLRNTTDGGIENAGLLCNRGLIFAESGVTVDEKAWGNFLNSGKRRFVTA